MGNRSFGRGQAARSGSTLILAAAVWCLMTTPVSALRITEVHYHPNPADDPTESLEFVEIYNDLSIPIDLSGAYFASGIEFAFPGGTLLASRARLVVCRDVDAVVAKYGIANAIGNFTGRLDNGGERIEIVTASGQPLVSLRYEDDYPWPPGADGTGHTLSLRGSLLDPDRGVNWVRSGQPDGTPGIDNFPPPIPEYNPLTPETGPESTVRYKVSFDVEAGAIAEFSDPPAAWRAPDFADDGWASGELPIGYPAEDVATLIEGMEDNFYSFAVRKSFEVTQEEFDAMDSLVLRISIDDGGVFFLNGQLVTLLNMRDDTLEEISVESRARRSRNLTTSEEITIPKERVQVGTNVLAASVHNVSLGSNDGGVGLGIGYRTFRFFQPPPVAQVDFNEIVSQAPDAERGIELINRLGMPLPLDGYHVSDDPGEPLKYVFPDDTVIAANGVFAVSEAELGFALTAEELRLFLYRSDGSVESAAHVDNPAALPEEARSHSRLPGRDAAWALSTTPSLGESNIIELETGLVINEIMYHPRLVDEDNRPLVDTARGEYVEIYNRSEREIPLAGYSLRSAIRYDFPGDATIGPGSYIVVARDVDYVRSRYELGADIVVGLPGNATEEELDRFGTLSNSGDRLRLVDPLGNTIDDVRYFDEGQWDVRADNGGSSLELIDPDADNSSGHAWRGSIEEAPWIDVEYTARLDPVAPGPADPEIHLYLLTAGECLVDDVSVAVGATEHIANGDFEDGDTRWRLWGNHEESFHTTEDARSGEGSLHIVASGGGNNKANRVEAQASRNYPRGEGTIRVSARWITGSNALHVCGHNNAFGRTVWLPVPTQPGTPGRENSVRADNLGPVVSNARHFPAVPLPTELITFRADVADEDGIDEVNLHYLVDGDEVAQMISLNDAGEDGDEVAGDGRYGGRIPSQSDGAIVNFWFETKDSLGATHAYPWDAPEKTWACIVDQPIESPLLRQRVVLNSTNNRRLDTQFLHSNHLIRGTFVFEEEEVYYDVGFRYHGSPWNRPGSPRMFRVRFNGDHRYRDEFKKFNISRYGSAQNEGTGYQLLAKASVPGAVVPTGQIYDYHKVYRNAAQHSGGALAHVSVIDKDYADFNWPEDSGGMAWKITGKLAFNDSSGGRGPDMQANDWTAFRRYRGAPYAGEESPENLRYYWHPKILRDQDDFSPLIALLRAMDRTTTPDEVFEETIEGILNVESFFRTFIIRVLQDDWDTIGIGNGQNAYLYYAPIEGRCYLLPWDMDHTFANTGATLIPRDSAASGVSRLYNYPKYRRLYGSILKEFTETFWSNAYLTSWTSAVAEDAGPGGVNSPNGILGFARTRVSRVNSTWRTSFAAGFAVTSDLPIIAEDGVATITGTAPLDARSFLTVVDDGDTETAAIEWASAGSQFPTRWTMRVDVPGDTASEVQIFAFSRSGDLVATETVTVIPDPSKIPFLRGEVNGDDSVNLADAVAILEYLFGDGRLACEDAADVDDTGRVNITDPIYLLLHLFADGPEPPSPFSEPGLDPTEDDIACLPTE